MAGIDYEEPDGSPVTPRVPESQKGDYGRILLVAGSRGKTGAAHLAAASALRSGAGLVTVATPASCQPILATLGVEHMTDALEETPRARSWEALDRILDADADVIAIGPGLGRSPSTMALVQAVVERAGVPIVLDADGTPLRSSANLTGSWAETTRRSSSRRIPGRWRA